MKDNFNQKFASVKEQLKALLDSKEMNAESIKAIANLDKALDEVNAEHEGVVKQNSELKEQLIDSIKNTSFNKPLEIGSPVEETLSLDEIVNEAMSNAIKESK